MQQRHLFHVRGEVVIRDGVEEEVGGRAYRILHAAPEIGEIPRAHKERPGEQTEDEHAKERRQDAPRTAFVESGQCERALLLLAADDGGNEKAGDDEEDIHAHEAAAESRESGVEEHHSRDRDGAQAVNVWAIKRRRLAHEGTVRWTANPGRQDFMDGRGSSRGTLRGQFISKSPLPYANH